MLRQRLYRTLTRRLSSDARVSRPFRVLGLQQIAIGALNKSPLTSLWRDLLGARPHSTFESAKENVTEDILILGPSHSPWSIEVDLMQPLDPDRSPAPHIPTLNHIGLWVDNLPAAVKYLESAGVRFAPGGIRRGATGHDICFIHPKGNDKSPLSGCGVLIELVQATPEVITAYDNKAANTSQRPH